MSKKKFLGTLLVILAFLIVATEPTFNLLHNNLLRNIEETHLEALFSLLIASSISAIILLPQPLSLFRLWFKNFYVFYFPIVYGATFLFSPYGGITTIGRYEAAIFFGLIMILVTVIWSFIVFLKSRQKNS